MTKLDDSNIFFNKIGNLQRVEGKIRIVKGISVGIIGDKIRNASAEINLMYNKCCLEEHANLMHKLEILEHDFTAVLSMVDSRKRTARAINFIGSGMKYLFGVMDHDDKVALNNVLANISNQQDELHDIMTDQVDIIRRHNANFLVVQKNQEKMYSNFVKFKNEMERQASNYNRLKADGHLTQGLLHAQDLISSIDMEVNKLHNAILFAKAGILDPYIINTDEVFNRVTKRDMRYQVSHKDIDNILRYSDFSVVVDNSKQIFYLMLKVPVASPQELNLYEALVLPKIDDSQVVSVVDVEKYFAISDDKLHYMQEKAIDCFVTSQNKHICRNIVLKNVGNFPSCLTNIFTKQTDNLCEYRRYLSDFDAHSRVKGGLLLFSSQGLRVNYTCGTYKDTEYFKGAVLIHALEHCVVESDKFAYETNQFLQDVDLGNEVPAITCCSPFYKYEKPKEVSSIPSIKLHSLQTIDQVGTETINKDLHKLKKFGKVYLPDLMKESNWKFWIVCVISIVIFFYILYKFQYLIIFCCSCGDKSPTDNRLADRYAIQYTPNAPPLPYMDKDRRVAF